MNVLVIAPHPDDEAIGCGGALCLHVATGDRVAAVFLTSGELGLTDRPPEEARRVREAEAKAAGEVLGLSRLAFLRGPDWHLNEHVGTMAARLRELLDEVTPALIYVPHAGDDHPDHRASLPILRAAIVGRSPPALATYEVWSPLPTFDFVVDATDVMARKLKAVRCHRSQLGLYRYDRAVRGLNQYRGILTGRCRYAEVFQCEGGAAITPPTGRS